MYAIDEIDMMTMVTFDEIANDPWSWPTVSDDPTEQKEAKLPEAFG